ncbi:MAG: SCP2 sterol-binding domain-containing protein [Ruminococcaceae bacterium]|nr:SCP2 sterol-binding domain-containing protein [Oscillospiraceae bacterium]
MTYEEIVATAKEILEPKDVSKMEGHLAVQIDVTGEGEGAFYVELKEGQLHVEPYEYIDRDCKLIASADTLTKLISGKLDAVLAFTTGKLRVEGSIDKALEFQKLLTATAKPKAKAKAKTTAKKAK